MNSKVFRKFILSFFILFFIVFQSVSQNYQMQGKIYDTQTGKGIIGASISIENTSKGTFSSADGYYKFENRKGSFTLIINSIGYKETRKEIILHQDTILNVPLQPKDTEIEKIVINSDKKNSNIHNTNTGVTKIDTKDVRYLPSFFGQTDLVQIIKLTPGVQSGGDLNTGMHVRGGSNGQNLILIDGVPLYNPTHLLGLASVFNASLIHHVEIHKSGVPAYYGGRTSSVLDVQMLQNQHNKSFTKIDIGLLTSGVSSSINFNNNKGVLLIGIRRSSFDIIQQAIKPLIKKKSIFIHESDYFFYDANIKLDYKFSPTDKIEYVFYSGADNYLLNRENSKFSNQMNWGNIAGKTNWKHRFSDNLLMQNTLGHTFYNFALEAHFADVGLNLENEILDYFYQLKFDYTRFENHIIKTGLDYTFHNIIPNKLIASASDFYYQNKARYFSREAGIYMNDQFELAENWKFEAGLRLNLFQHIGPFTQYIEDPQSPFLDSLQYNSKKIIQQFFEPEINLAANYMINPNLSIKASAAHNIQFLHLVPFGSVALPADFWMPGTIGVPPEKTDQASAGIYIDFNEHEYQTSIEVYAKKMDNQALFLSNLLNNFDNRMLTDKLAFGNGTSYGAEFFLKKKQGKATGWISYTWSKTQLTFEKMANGNPFPAKYDKTHDLSIIYNQQLSKNWTISSLFSYTTGNAITLPEGRYMIQRNVINHYTSINAFRMPDYHRLDIALNYTTETEKKHITQWSFGIYNLYNRKNPFYFYFEITGNLEEYYLHIENKQMSLFPIMPYISWNLTI